MFFEVLAGVTGIELASLVGTTVLSLGKGALEDYVKDFFKDNIKTGILSVQQRQALQVGMAQAIALLTRLFEKELKVRRVEDAIANNFLKQPFQNFLKDPAVKQILGSAFGFGCTEINIKGLAEAWKHYHPYGKVILKPEQLDWDRIGFDYLDGVQGSSGIIETTPELRDVLNIQLQRQQTEAVQEMAGPKVGFDLNRYRKSLREQYEFLKLESLGASKYEKGDINYRTVPLWDVFVAQTAREVETVSPQLLEIPKDQLRRMQAEGLIDENIEEIWQEQEQGKYFDTSPRSVLEICDDPHLQYQVILGDPGAGKSTLLRYLAVRWATQGLLDANSPIPLLIELRRYINSKSQGECQNFLEFIHQGSNWVGNLNQLELEKLLNSGQVLVLFDGLDEVVERTQRGNVLKSIHGFTQNYPQAKVIVTSRVIGYRTQDLRDAGFRHFMLQDLDSDQIRQFVVDWHRITYGNDNERQRKQSRLEGSIERSKAIRELAANPLLLTLMAILNRGEELPRDRLRLYEKATEVLLYQWDFEEKEGLVDPRLQRYLVELDYRDKRAMLQQVAYKMQSSEKGLAGNFVTREVLEDCLAEYLRTKKDATQAPSIAGLIIDQLRERNFILCALGDDNYAFIHRTFLEYFCASEIVERFGNRGTPEGLEFNDLRDEVFGHHWQDEAWHEVLRLICGEIPPQFAGDLIESLMRKNVDRLMHIVFGGRSKEIGSTFGEYIKTEGFKHILLAADCVEEVRNRAEIQSVSQRLCKQLQAELEQEYPFWLTEDAANSIVERLAMIWGDTDGMMEWLMACVNFDPRSFLPESSVKAIAQFYHSQSETPIFLKDCAQYDRNEDVRHAAIQELARGWKEDPETLTFLKDRARQDDDEDVRSAATDALARGWKEDPETLTFLKDLVRHDESWNVRRTAVHELARGWKEAPETLTFLKDCAQQDDEYVRRVAIQELARGWKGDPETLSILKDLVQQDDQDDYDVRLTAVQELARGWKEHPETLSFLKERARQDVSWFVRLAAVQELARGWNKDPETLSILKDRAQQDVNRDVRRAAIQELARGWKEHSETLSFLKDRVQQDNDKNVRHAAIHELARGWKEHPETLSFLKDHVQQDNDMNVRHAAIQELARGWKEHPETLSFLKERVQQDNDENVRRAAIQELARGWKEHPETLSFLKERVQQDVNRDVRHAAIQELARGWKEHPETLSFLKERVQQDDNGYVRGAAIHELARGWKEHPETLSILKERVQQDDNGYVRRAAIQELARGWKEHPETLSILKDRAQQDDSGDVRRAAIQELARGWKEHPETLTILKGLARHDDKGDVRLAAVLELVCGWKDDLGSLPILVHVATQAPFMRQEQWENNPRQNALEILLALYKENEQIIPLLRDRAQNDDDEQLREWAQNELVKIEKKQASNSHSHRIT